MNRRSNDLTVSPSHVVKFEKLMGIAAASCGPPESVRSSDRQADLEDGRIRIFCCSSESEFCCNVDTDVEGCQPCGGYLWEGCQPYIRTERTYVPT